MAEQPTIRELSSTLKAMPAPQKTPAAKKGGRGWLGILFLTVLAVVAFVQRGAIKSALGIRTETETAIYQLYTTEKGPLTVAVSATGNVESSSNEDVKCEVEGGSQILSIIKEGEQVKKGTELVKLDSSKIEDAMNAQQIVYEKARSAKIQAEEDVAVAEIGIKEFLEGTFIQNKQTAEANIVIAKENLKSAQNSLDHSEKMFRKGYINEVQLETNRFSVQKAQLDLDNANTTLKVLSEFTRAKTVKELESKRDTAMANLSAQNAALELEKSKLERLKEQKKRCIMHAPQDGMVIYANDVGRSSRGGGSSEAVIEEGANVRQFQTIIRLPDLSKLQVKVLVHETKVDKLRPGMRADIRIRDTETTGTVEYIASQVEPGSWFSSSVKEYSTIVSIDSSSGTSMLKPGMTAEVQVIVQELHDVISVPLLAVSEQGDKYFCYVLGQRGPEKRPVVLGASNDKFIEIKDGLNVGEKVVLNPRSSIPEARKDAEELKRTGGRSAKNGDPKASKASEKDAKGAPAEKSAKPATPEAGKEGPPSESKEKAGKGGFAGKGEAKPKGGRGSFDFMSFDKNKDGKVGRDEMPERMRAGFDGMDANKDGGVDAKEAADAARRFQEQMRAKGGPGGPGGPPGGGPAG